MPSPTLSHSKPRDVLGHFMQPICNENICNATVDYICGINAGTVVFNDLSSVDAPCTIDYHYWTFGDDNVSNDDNPTHIIKRFTKHL